jgi:hypothetical protein
VARSEPTAGYRNANAITQANTPTTDTDAVAHAADGHTDCGASHCDPDRHADAYRDVDGNADADAHAFADSYLDGHAVTCSADDDAAAHADAIANHRSCGPGPFRVRV